MSRVDDGFKLDEERVGGGGWCVRKDVEFKAVDGRICRQESGDVIGLRRGDGRLGGDDCDTAVPGS